MVLEPLGVREVGDEHARRHGVAVHEDVGTVLVDQHRALGVFLEVHLDLAAALLLGVTLVERAQVGERERVELGARQGDHGLHGESRRVEQVVDPGEVGLRRMEGAHHHVAHRQLLGRKDAAEHHAVLQLHLGAVDAAAHIAVLEAHRLRVDVGPEEHAAAGHKRRDDARARDCLAEDDRTRRGALDVELVARVDRALKLGGPVVHLELMGVDASLDHHVALDGHVARQLDLLLWENAGPDDVVLEHDEVVARADADLCHVVHLLLSPPDAASRYATPIS